MSRSIEAFCFAALLWLAAGCKPEVGERCNPLQFNVREQCSTGLICVYPPNCGVAFCCPPSADLAGQGSPPACLFPPNCSGADCCPATGVADTSNARNNCLPCPAPDASAAQ
jgi:hypothetical protein